MKMYNFIQAVEYVAKPQDMGTSKWTLVRGEDDVVYQVKFNQDALSSNINEFIGNYLGFCIGVPVPDGNFLMIPDNILEECINNLGFTIDMETVKNNLFFGIKWIYGQVNFSNIDLLIEEIKNSTNYKEYPSIFPYDQYLRNADRHIDNHLIIQHADKQRFYYSIDSDRIFESYPHNAIEMILNNFDCFENPVYEDLYRSIDDELFAIMLRYADKVDKITDEQIEKIDEYLESCYECNLDIRELIISFLKTRRVIVSKCVDNQGCYDSLNNQILIS